MKITILSTPGCVHCHEVKVFLESIQPEFPGLDIEEIDMLTPEGQALVEKHQIMASPGVFMDGELIGVGGVNKGKLLERLRGEKT